MTTFLDALLATAPQTLAAARQMTGGAAPAAAPSGGNWLAYANEGATRNDPLAPELVQALSFLPDLGVRMEVFSGGQEAAGEGGARTGSTRHDHGHAADVFFYDAATGRRLDWANPQDVPRFQEIVRQARARGVTGFGAGDGYMRPGSMHIGFGAPAAWGAGGSGRNAAPWLVEAFNGASAGPAPVGVNGPRGGAAPQGGNALAGAPYYGPDFGAGGMDMTALSSLAQGQNALAQAMLGLQSQQPAAPPNPFAPTGPSGLDPADFMVASRSPPAPLYGFGPGASPFYGA